ncbi:MAG: N-acetylornithine carbamoyltransferase, partial [Bdellovibrionales bacterium]|nr:N-acetylornithine carbamoyltransferase [Bdellovibrionales bacterium]
VTPGSGTWAFETDFGVRMDSDKPEHIKEAIRVMARYVDILGVRTFASLSSLQDDAEERVLSAFEEYSTVPLVSLESAMEHPCQMIADMLTIRERLSETRGKTFCLRWAPHIKSLPMAVPNSAALAGALLGMNLTIAAPKGYELHERYSTRLQQLCDASGTTFQHVTSLNEIPSDCEILYVKSWGAPEFYGNPTAQTKSFESHKSWMVDENDLGSTAYLMHCLPVRRNVVVSDRALDHERSVIIDQAENRLWGQLAVLNDLRA